MAISNNMIGTAGEYYVCAELCRKNVLALLTPKNNPLFDIMASDPNGKRKVAIQVKTMSVHNKQGWKLSMSITKKQNNPNLFVILVNMLSNGTNEYYIYKHDQLSKRVEQVYEKYLAKPKKDGTSKKDLNFRFFDFRYFNISDKRRLNRWDLLGFDI